MSLGSAALRRFREQQDARARQTGGQGSLLEQVPVDAPYEAPDAALHAWNGQKWVPWSKWLATAPVAGEKTMPESKIPADAACVTAHCGGTRVWIVRDGERWSMYAGSRATEWPAT